MVLGNLHQPREIFPQPLCVPTPIAADMRDTAKYGHTQAGIAVAKCARERPMIPATALLLTLTLTARVCGAVR